MSRAFAAVLLAAAAVRADHVHCHAGSYEVTVELFGSTTCVPCAKGRYQDQDHQKSCKECPTGKYSDGWRAAACHSCPQGRVSQYIDRKACVEPPPAELANGFGHHAANETLGAAARDAHSGDAVTGSTPSEGLVQHIIHSETHRIEQWSTHQKLGSAPFLYPREDGPDSWSNPGNIKDSIGACQEQCMQVERCAYGTYITSGERAGECWLAAQTLLPLSHSESCGVPCISFRKVESTTGQVAPYMSPGMVEEEEEVERAQLHGVESALHHAQSDGIDFDDMQLSSFHHAHPGLHGDGIAAHVSTLSASQSELNEELHHQEAMIERLHKEQTELQRNISAQLYTLHKRQLVLHEKHAQHRDIMHKVVAEQAGLQQKLTLLESKLLAIAPKSGLNYTELENAIDAQVALSLQNHDHDHGLSAAGEHSMDSAAELALALDAAHRQAVAHAGGFAHFEKAGLVCQPPPIPQNGYTLAFSKSDRVVGGKVRFSCNYGFKLVGDGVRKCQSDLSWSGQVTFCETFTPAPTPAPTPVVTHAPTPAPTPTQHCGHVPQPPNALVAGVDLSLPSYPPGAIVFFRCKDGFRRIGQDASKCDGGIWHSPPTCVAGAHVCSHLSCKLRRTHEVIPGHPGYHLQIHHDRFEQRGTKHRCQYHGDPQEGKLDPTDCVCLCWNTATSVLRR